MKKYLEAGKIVNTHGVHGDLRLEAWADSPESLSAIKKLYLESNQCYTPVNITKATVHKSFLLLHFEGCDSFEDAIIYKNRILFADRDDINKGEGDIFVVDLIGLPVIDAGSGRVYGSLKDVITGGCQDIYEIDTGKGTVLMPAVKEYVDRIDTDSGIYITPIEGFFDEV